MRGLTRVIRGITLLSVTVSGVILNVVMLLLVANVVLRLLNRPILGLYEVLTACTVVLLGLSLGDSQREKQHVAIDLVTARFPPRVQTGLVALTTALSVIVFTMIAVALLRYAALQVQAATASEILRIPTWPALAALIFGIFLLVSVLAVDLIRSAQRALRPAHRTAEPDWKEAW